MGLPILPHEQRPYIRLKKRSGTFPDGSGTYDPNGNFEITINENKTTIVSATVDNTPRYGTSRYIDSLSVGDSLILVMKDSSGNEDCLFNGLIETVEYTGENNNVELHAADHSVYGENVYLNSVIYQKFTSNEEISMETRGADEYYSTLPADTTEYAPMVIEMRQTYGSHLNAKFNYAGIENNNIYHTRAMPVYSGPTPSGFTLRTVGGLGRDDTGTGAEGDPIISYPDDTNPNATVERATSTRYGDPTVTNISSTRIATNKQSAFSDGARKFVAQVFTPYQDDQLTWIFFNINKCIRRYPSQCYAGKFTEDTIGSWGSAFRDLAPSGDPAKQLAIADPTSFTDAAGFWNSNVYIEAAHTDGGYGFQHVAGVPQGGAIDTANYGQAYNTFGPGMDLKVTLVKAVEADPAGALDDGVTITKTPQHVPNKTHVPSPDKPVEYDNDYTTGIDWNNKREVSDLPEFGNCEVINSIIISATQPVPAPHFPAGVDIRTQYLNGATSMAGMNMADMNQGSNMTQFGWNLESNPVAVEKGEKYALIFEMLGDPAHPKLDDGVDIGGDANTGGYLTPHCWWNVACQLNDAFADSVYNTETRPYSGGELLGSMLTDTSGNATGYHGEYMWNPTLRTKPGYSVTYGTPNASSPYLDAHGPAITGANFGHWEMFDWLSSQKKRAMEFDVMMAAQSDGTEYTIDMDEFMDMAWYSGAHKRLNMYFTVIGGGWRILGENLYWKLHGGEIRYDVGTSNWQPVVDVGWIKMARLDYYSNPASGGLLRASDKSTVRDVVHAICAKVPQFSTIIVDGTGDGADDAYGTGYNDVSNYELSYWSAISETAWESLQRLANEYDAKLSIITDLSGATTVMFEAKTTISDFSYSAPGLHQYCVSNRSEDPSNLKFLRTANLKQDVGNMYTRFRVTGSSPSTNATPTQIPGLPTGSANETPITWVLNVPDMENIIGYRKEYEFKSNKNVTSFEIAKKAAEALKIIYAQDKYSGKISLMGCHPIYDNATHGIKFDNNSVVRLMDKFAVTGDSPTGTTNVFRVTGINYNSREHVTDLKITTVIEVGEYVASQEFIKELKKNVQEDLSGRNYTELAYSTTVRTYSTTWTVTLKTQAGTSLGNAAAIETIDDGTEFYVIASFPPGNATIISDTAPAYSIDVDHTSQGLVSITLENTVYKWDKDNLTVIIRFQK